MSNADEMFEKLGYEKDEEVYENEVETVKYRKIIKDDVFEDIVKIIELNNPKFYHYPIIRLTQILKRVLRKDDFDLLLNELQAINQKCKELGWIE